MNRSQETFTNPKLHTVGKHGLHRQREARYHHAISEPYGGIRWDIKDFLAGIMRRVDNMRSEEEIQDNRLSRLPRPETVYHSPLLAMEATVTQLSPQPETWDGEVIQLRAS